MQVDPIRPKLKAPGTKPLKLQYDEPLSTFAFKFKLRRYNEVLCKIVSGTGKSLVAPFSGRGRPLVHFSAQPEQFCHLNTDGLD